VPPTVTAAPTPVATEVATAAPAAPLPPLDPSLPAGSAGVAAIDVAQADAILGAFLRAQDPERRARVERFLHLAGGALADGQVARTFGLDPARPILASVGLVGGGGTVRERLAALVGRKVTTQELRAAFEGAPPAGVALRAVFPAMDPSAVMTSLAALFEADRWTAAPPPDGVDELYVARNHRAFGGVTRAPGVVVADVVIPAGIGGDDEKADHDRGVALLRSIRARAPGSPSDAAPSLEGHPARARYAPAAFADIGLVVGVATTLRALSSPGIADEQRDAIAAQGFAESATSRRLAGASGGAYFDRLDATLDGGYGTLGFTIRADRGTVAAFPPEPWARGPAIDVPGAFAVLDLSVPWLRSWESVGVALGQRRALRDAVREAGWAGMFAAAPQTFAAEIWEPMERVAGHRDLLAHLDRMSIFTLARGTPDGWVALLKPATKPADVRCAFADGPARGGTCAADQQIKPGATVQRGGFHVRLAQVKTRWALVVSRDKAVAEKTKIELGTAAAGRVLLPGASEWARESREVPPSFYAEGYTGEITLEGRSAVARFRPITKPPAKKR
jgi:hypothetical protein